MAGYLPDVSGIRLPFATDGTYVTFGNSTGGYSPVASNNVTAISNAETTTSYVNSLTTGDTRYLSFVFPQSRDINGVSIRWSSSHAGIFLVSVDVSTDTTDGVNGTWENGVVYNGGSAISGSGMNNAWLRQNPYSISRTGIKGLRIRHYNSRPDTQSLTIYSFNIFGTYSYPGLNFWHPTLDQALPGAYFDLGDVIQGQQYTKQFRIKNTATQDAVDTVISSSAGFGAMGGRPNIF